MKKILLICASTLFLTACADKQKYTDAVLEQMKTEKDLKDYNIDPEYMTKCVVELSSNGMPGAFPLDPARLTSYQNYTKMLSMSTAEDKQSMLEELRSTFGSPAELASAHSNYTESVMNCIASIIVESEDSQEKEELKAIEKKPIKETPQKESPKEE
ncbi:MAG: hypothetical protein KAH20_03865 [Methylococcales bacterium]|nr:hypothetical protein [Methylococcales bacterium]